MKNSKAKIRSVLLAFMIPSIALSSVGNSDNDPAVGIEPVVDNDFYSNGKFPRAQVELGRSLFFDKILSGNKNISCASCHHPELGTSDALALSLGEGAEGLGEDRHVSEGNPILGRVPRNSPAIFFLGAKEYVRMFHDGRVEKDEYNNWDSGFWSPAREQLPAGLDNVLAVQAMFPVTSDVEMAGQKGENEIADAAAVHEMDRAWDLLARRLQKIPEYVLLFKAAYPHIDKASDIRFVDAANAIAAFETVAFRADNSPFDTYLRTRDKSVLSESAQQGMDLFYGKGRCGECHSGKLQSDHEFHAIAMPQIGPGKNDGWDQSYWQTTGYMARLEDHGRARVTQREEDKYRFRTPSLRNVELTAPYGHSGAFNTLEEVIRHHTNPVASLESYNSQQAKLPPVSYIIEKTAERSSLIFRAVNPRRLDDFRKRDTWVMNNRNLRRAIANANELTAIPLTKQEIEHLVAFLKSLTDPASANMASIVPDNVPSGLKVED